MLNLRGNPNEYGSIWVRVMRDKYVNRIKYIRANLKLCIRDDRKACFLIDFSFYVLFLNENNLQRLNSNYKST